MTGKKPQNASTLSSIALTIVTFSRIKQFLITLFYCQHALVLIINLFFLMLMSDDISIIVYPNINIYDKFVTK